MPENWDNFVTGPPPTDTPDQAPPPRQATLPPPHMQPEEPPKVAAPTAGFHGYTLPREVMDNKHWSGDETDLRFGLREPDAEGTWQFMEKMTGRPEDVLPHLAAGGRHRGGAELNGWWLTRTPKIKNCILQAFIELVVPTTADVESVRSSKRRSADRTSYQLPVSVMDSMHWKGGPDDLTFQLRDATTTEVRQLGARSGEINDCLEFVDRGDAKTWWGNLSPKAQALVNRMFVDTLQPTEDEGKSIRASRTWVAG